MTDEAAREPGLDATPDQGGVARRGARIAALVAAVAFVPSLLAGYVYDDTLLISQNPLAQSLSHLLRGFRTHLWDVYAFGEDGFGLRYYRPLVSASYVLNWVFGGGAAWTFHLVNVLCHAAVAWLAARAASRWTGSPVLGLVAALLFAIHPTRTESVIWISGRTDVFMALFSLAAADLALSAARASGGPKSGVLSAAAIASTVLSILSKEAGALTALFIGIDFALEQPGSRVRHRLRGLGAVIALVGALYVGGRAVFYPVGGNRPLEITPAYGFFTIWAYVERLAFPWPQTFFYRPAEAVDGHPHFAPLLVGLGVLCAVAFVGVILRAWRRDRPAALVLCAGAALILPLLNFSYTGIYVTTSDHFLYLPLLLFAAGLLRLCRGALLRFAEIRAARILAFGVGAVYVAIDVIRVLDYRSDAALWHHEMEVNPDNPVALIAESRMRAEVGDVEEAFAIIQRAVRPEARKYFLLAGERGARMVTEGRLLALRAALTADGDIVTLRTISDEQERLFRSSRSPKTGLPLGEAGAMRALRENGQLAAMASDIALVSSRLGRTERTRVLVDAIPEKMLPHVSNPLNLVLARARSLDVTAGRRLLAAVVHAVEGTPAAIPRETIAGLSARLGRAEAHVAQARAQGDAPPARVERALALAELGAYLAALRELRPAYEGPLSRQVAPLYVQLLLSARLPREAEAALSAVIGPDGAKAAIADFERALPPALARLTPPAEPSPWWPP